MINIIKTTGYAYENTDYAIHIKEKLNALGHKAKILSGIYDIDKINECIREPIIISGGSTGVMDNFEWLDNLKAFLKERIQHHKDIPLLGVCFGSQLIAETYDRGCVIPASKINIGLKSINTIKEDTIFNSMYSAYSFHFHIITSKKLEVFSEGILDDKVFVNAFKIPNSNIFGTQFHPEFDENIFKNLLSLYKDWLKNDFSIHIENVPLGQENNKVLEQFVALCNKNNL